MVGGRVVSIIHLSSILFLKEDMKYGKILVSVNLGVWVNEFIMLKGVLLYMLEMVHIVKKFVQRMGDYEENLYLSL